MNPVLFAVSQIFSGPEYGIRKNPFWVMSIGFSVVFYGFLKGCAFIKGIPAQIFYSEISVYITHLHLGPKFDFRILFSSNNGPYPGLRETDDPVFNSVGVGAVHLLLL
jgi:hypothetical protein